MNLAPLEQVLRDEIGLDAESIGRGAVERVLLRRLDPQVGEDAEACAQRLRNNPILLRQVIEDLVVPETWFFRDGRPFDVLAQEAVKRRRRGEPVRVLCLPCATGEEAWTIAITLREAGLGPQEFHVAARDVSQAAVAAAQRAEYGANSFRGEIGPWRERWLEAAPRGWRVRDALRGTVDFAVANVFASGGGEARWDFVFCRNLLIYFDPERQAEALRLLRGQMAPDGLLFVGHAEAAVARREGFAPWPAERSFAFSIEARAPRAVVPPRARAAVQKAPAARVVAAAPIFRPGVSPAPAPAPAVVPGLVEIRALADAGRLAEAARAAEQRMAQHGGEAETHYLLGLAREAAGEVVAGETAYRKALYLDPGHGSALAQLAALLERRGEAGEAGRLRARARRRGGDA